MRIYDDLPIIPDKNQEKTIKRKGYYVRFNRFYKRKNYILVYFDSHKITVYEFIERLSKDLKLYIKSKGFIKSFCSHIKREVKRELQLYETLKKRKNYSPKKVTHLFKGNSEFRIGDVKCNINSKESIGLGYIKFKNMVMELKSSKIVNKKSIYNLYNLRKLFPYLESNFRFHEFRWVFSILDIEILDIIKHIINCDTIRDKNLSIWTNNTTEQKATSITISISSRVNSKLCNLELRNEGFKQIYKRLPKDLAIKLCLKLYTTKCSNEFGNKLSESKEFFQKLGFDFIEKRIYKVYGLSYWLDCSHRGVELEFKYNGYIIDIYRMLKLIELFKSYVSLYEKGILTIEPFTLKNNRLRSKFSLEGKRSYKLRDFVRLVKTFFKWIIPRKKNNT